MYITVPSNIFDIFFNGMISLAWIVVNFYIIAVEFRFLLNWFLNVNPFYEPFLSLWLWTNPIFCFGRSFYPKVFSWEPAPLINFQILYLIQAKLGSFVKNLNDGLPPGFNLETPPEFDLETPPEFDLETPPELVPELGKSMYTEYPIANEWLNEIVYGIPNFLFKVGAVIREWFSIAWGVLSSGDLIINPEPEDISGSEAEWPQPEDISESESDSEDIPDWEAEWPQPEDISESHWPQLEDISDWDWDWVTKFISEIKRWF